jgi:hypothetical protein
MSVIINGTDGVTFNDASLQGAAASPYVLKNRIINGAMEIDQRNAGASVTPTSPGATYTLDRWRVETAGGGVYTVQRSTVAPSGFINSLLVTVTTADSSIAAADYYNFQQFIEGFNVAYLASGTANAQTVKAGFNIILSDPNVKAILINIFGGIVRCDRVAQGVIDAYKEIGNIPVPIIVRLQGTNAEIAKDLIDNSGMPILSAVQFQEAADQVKAALS